MPPGTGVTTELALKVKQESTPREESASGAGQKNIPDEGETAAEEGAPRVTSFQWFEISHRAATPSRLTRIGFKSKGEKR